MSLVRVAYLRTILALALCSTAGVAFAAPPSVKVSPAQERAMGLRTAVATPVSVAPVATIPATAQPAMNGRVVVAAPFAGLVLKVLVLEGDSVRAGQPLAVLFSQDALRVGSELAQANAELSAAQAAARRARTLAEEGIIAGARAEEAEARAAQARAIASEKRRLVAATGGGGRPGEYVLRAPIAGRVAQLDLQPGGGLEAMAPAATIDRNDRTWVEARLPAALAGRVKLGAPVDVDGLAGRVVAVGSAIDPRTRSVTLRAELASGAALMPGRNAWITVNGPAPAGAMAIPREAVLPIEGRNHVFVRGGGGFQPVPVTVLGTSRTQVVVTGLAHGAVIASTGVSQLKSATAR